MFKISGYLILLAAFVAFLLSVYLWFSTDKGMKGHSLASGFHLFSGL